MTNHIIAEEDLLLNRVNEKEKTTKVIITLGKTAFDAYCRVYNVRGLEFGHNKI
jgi:hypothetical protein